MKQPLGTLLVVSGPSGSGKTTLCRRATENGLCVYSISCTTRQPRPGEVNGVDYHFLTAAEFAARVERGDFLEYAEVHGNRYGTLKADILNLLEQGKNVVMDIGRPGPRLPGRNPAPMLCGRLHLRAAGRTEKPPLRTANGL